MREAILEIADLCTSFGNAVVHDHISLEIMRGEVFAIAGSSGCGKSTLLREIMLLQKP
ncbi:MAG: ATP-binding cassette domain-containing protein, partial [Burkholderiales bacterium]